MTGLVQGNPFPYRNPLTSQASSLQDYLQASSSIMGNDYLTQPKPQFDYLALANQANQGAADINFQSTQNIIHNSMPGSQNNGGPPVDTGNPRLNAILRALRMQESHNNYRISNGDSGAAGAYQIMPGNFTGSGGWDMEALGRNVTLDQFIHSNAIQDAIARYKFGQMFKAHGIRGALSQWYSGDPNAYNNRDSQGNYPSVHDYVLQVLHRLGIG